VRLPNGGILVLGGLLEHEELPLLGQLFEGKLTGNEVRELVILLSARTVRPGVEALGPAE
jgi:type II secretory pathway component GspD/PulD (secretin)